jgi:hypothetical protein
MEFVVVRIVAGDDSADNFPVATREKELGVAMSIKGMLFAVEKLLALDQKRRDPCGVIRINAPGKFDERVAIFPAGNFGYFDLRHRAGPIYACCR